MSEFKKKEEAAGKVEIESTPEQENLFGRE